MSLYGQSCGTVDPTYDILAGYPSGKMTGNDGPYYIKVYPVIVRKSDYSEGASEQEVIAAIEEMQADFKDHNIFFNYACISYLNDTYDYYNPEDAFGSYSGPTDGISLLLYDIILTGDAGRAGIPGRKLYAHLNTAKTLSHEMGHALGLYHTHNGASCLNGSSNNELVSGDECEIRGDYVCDTDAAPDFFGNTGSNYQTCVYSNSSCVDPTGAPYVNADMTNMMSYGLECRNHFTIGQGERMRNTLANQSVLEDVQRNWAYIKGNITIDVPHSIDIDVIVTEGSTLTYANTLSLAPETRIIVEQGARLNGDEATFTIGPDDTNCPTDDELWAGIYIASGAPYNHGFVYMEGCTLSCAKTALTWFDPAHTVANGRFTVRNSTFLNNETSIHLADKRQNGVNALPSTVFGSTFDIDEEYKGDKFDQHIYLQYANQGLHVIDTELGLSDGTVAGNKYGIRTYNSRLGVVDNGTHTIQTKLSGFNHAVFSNRGSAYNPSLTFRKVDFDLNTYGMETRSVSNVSVMDCDFNVPNVSSGYAGIVLQSSPAFTIMYNDFTSPGNTVANKYGIRLSNSSAASNVIYENMFENMGNANVASGMNGGPLSGLQYLCNTVTNSNREDFYVNANASISLTQGTPSSPAGNKFSQNPFPPAPAGSDFYNSTLNNSILYFFYSNPSSTSDDDQEPINFVNIDPQGRNIEPECLYRSLIFTDNDSLELTFELVKEEYDSLLTVYGLTPDGTQKQIIGAYVRDADIRMNILCNAALQLVQDDTVSIDWELTREWLDRKNSFYADIEIATTYIAEEADSIFHTFVSAMPGRRLFSTEDSTDYQLFIDLTSVILTAKGDNRTESELDSMEVEALEAIAVDNERMVAGMAKGILETFYGYTFADTITLRSFEVEEAPLDQSRSFVSAYPNPFEGMINFQFPRGSYSLSILDLMGAPIKLTSCDDCEQLRWNAGDLPGGFYIYQLSSTFATYSGLILKTE